MNNRYLFFSILKKLYAVPIAEVIEILPMAEITPIPHLSKCVAGVMNLRGKIIPIVDLVFFFEKGKNSSENNCVIVVEKMNILIGVIVTSVDDVHFIKSEDIQTPSKTDKTPYLKGIGRLNERDAILLELNSLLDPKIKDMNYV